MSLNGEMMEGSPTVKRSLSAASKTSTTSKPALKSSSANNSPRTIRSASSITTTTATTTPRLKKSSDGISPKLTEKKPTSASTSKNISDGKSIATTVKKPLADSSKTTTLPKTTSNAAAKSEKKMTSEKFDRHQQANVLNLKQKHVSNFGSAYQEGSIPCRINHGSVNMYIQWDISPQELDYNPLLVTCGEGLLETQHPYTLLARSAFKELLAAPGAVDKTVPLLLKIIPSIRTALRSTTEDTFIAGLKALGQLSDCVGEHLNVHIPVLIVPLNSKMSHKTVGTAVQDALGALDRNGGDDAARIIRTKIPTYCK
ncbi:hypothetical protein PROFUN_10298 [Planoprotostelium fungivorum]|uniref:PACRG-like protein n=1 Tax=Planoprotostelium fungivorum TaxID=1890364 RepID=A0A2P6MRS0_9EUKA|nr:hypothetical protein PROFUN_10298 [Planoprotostelium fungivorum]